MTRKNPESYINDRLADALKSLPDVRGERVENRIGSGRPDWELFMPGPKVVFVESKFIHDPKKPLKDWTLVQRNWARRMYEWGFRVLLLVGDRRETYLLNAEDHVHLDWILHPLEIWGDSINPDELERQL